MKFGNDFKYDLKVGQVKERELGDIFENKKIEVKTDLQASSTGNIFIEYESRGQKSGISTTESDYYCFCFNDIFIIIKTKDLKELCRRYIGSYYDVAGGDYNTSKGILLSVSDLINNGV
jgi:hypothetical protein